MSFPTVTFTGAASGASGLLSTTGTFTATLTGNPDGSVSGTWSFSGSYRDSSFYGTSGFEDISGTITGTGGPTGPWVLHLGGGGVQDGGLTLTYANGAYALGVNGAFGVDYSVNAGYDTTFTYHDDFHFAAQLAAAGAGPAGVPTEGADTLEGTAGADAVAALGGNDVVSAGAGNDTVTGGTGDDTIDGGSGIDTAVFSDVRANYTVSQVSGTAGTWTVTHNTAGDGTDTLVGVERLVFTDTKVAIDIDGDAGRAYRLYQAAFDRVPDLGGLGFQMNALDTGFTLEQVAGNFIASPEFQAKYGGAVDDTAFVTLLYQNVLHRAPDAGGLQFHLDELAHGQTRADVLIHFSESPENQANVVGAIGDGMVYVF